MAQGYETSLFQPFYLKFKFFNLPIDFFGHRLQVFFDNLF